MSEDKSIKREDLPMPQQKTDTQQPEEFIDKSSIRKDENDVPGTQKTPAGYNHQQAVDKSPDGTASKADFLNEK